MNALLPCPFCGGTVHIRERDLCGYRKHQIKCCIVNVFRSTPEAVTEAWNTRTRPENHGG